MRIFKEETVKATSGILAEAGQDRAHKGIKTSTVGVKIGHRDSVKDTMKWTVGESGQAANQAFGGVGLNEPRIFTIWIQGQACTEDDALVASVYLIDFSTNIGELVSIDSESPVRSLIICLNEDTLESLFLAGGGSIIIIIYGVNGSPGIVGVRPVEDTQRVVRRHHWHADHSVISRNDILCVTQHNHVELKD